MHPDMQPSLVQVSHGWQVHVGWERTGGKEASGDRLAKVGGGLCSLCMACTAKGSPL